MSSNGTKSSFFNTSDQHSSNSRFNVSGSGHLNPPEEDMNGRASLFFTGSGTFVFFGECYYLPVQEFPILINDNVKLSEKSKIGVDKENLATSMEHDDDLSVNSSINYANTKARTSDGRASGRFKGKESQQSIFFFSYHKEAEDFGQTV